MDESDTLLADMLRRDLRDTIRRADALIKDILDALPAALESEDKDIATRLGANYAHQCEVREKAELALIRMKQQAKVVVEAPQ